MFRRLYCVVPLVLVIVTTAVSGNIAEHILHRHRRQTSGDCLLPEASPSRKFCSLTDGCEDCDIDNRVCFIPPGSKVDRVRVVCAPGYTLRSPSSGGAVAICLNGKWYPNIPECYAIPTTAVSRNIPEHTLHRDRRQISRKSCPPLRSFKMNITCVLRDEEVPCNRNMKPGTTAKPKCERFYKPLSKPTYTRLTCLDNGKWDNNLFDCTPECGSSSLDRIFFRIVDGIEADTGTFPWHAGLYYRRNKNGAVTWVQQCSGTLITDQFVITVAHCVIDTEENDLRVALGKYYREWGKTVEGEVKRTVTKIIHQHDFSKKIYTFDIALLRLNEKVEFSETIMPVCRGFPGGTTHLKNKELYVAGWGLTIDGDKTSASDTLLYNSVVVVNEDICRKNSPSIYPTFDKFCTVKDDHSEVSIVQPGDSGGGITSVYDGLHVILGAVSAKENQYSIFTNFTWPYNVIWIESQMRKYDSSFRWDENDITQFQNSDRGCLLPEASSSRKFCSLTDGCEDCDIHDRICFIPPGSKVDRVRVVCAPGYTLRSPYSGGDVAICLNGQWYPKIPECHIYRYIPGNPWEKVTWQEARDNCVNKGYVLATIKNEGEEFTFKEAVLKFFNTTGIRSDGLWLGLSDLKFEGTFEWTDGSILGKSDLKNWMKSEPNNADKLEHCVGLSPKCNSPDDCFNWNDNYCSELNYYFCKEIEPSENLLDRIGGFGDELGINMKARPRYTYLPGNPWTKVTWDEARDNCMVKGSRLAIIRAPEQQKLFEQAVNQQFNATGTSPSSVWIGLRASDFNDKRLFNWTDGSTYNAWRGGWNNWITKRSNWNWHCTEAAAGDRLKLWPYATIYEWNDVNCTDLNYYFCSVKL